jgi:hypothetical protein
MKFKRYGDYFYISFFNNLEIFRCIYRTTVKTEYWEGYRRKRILKIGRITVWVRE